MQCSFIVLHEPFLCTNICKFRSFTALHAGTNVPIPLSPSPVGCSDFYPVPPFSVTMFLLKKVTYNLHIKIITYLPGKLTTNKTN